MDYKVVDYPAVHVASIRHVGPYENIGNVYMKLMTWAGKNNYMSQDTKVLGYAWDDPSQVDASKLRCDACVTVPSSVTEGEGDIKILDMPARRYATTLHKGSYSTLGPTYTGLYEWIMAQGHQLPETLVPCLEVYINTPDTTPEAELLTEVYMPIR